MQRFNIGSGKKKGESKSKSRSHQQPQLDAGLRTDFNQGGKGGSQKGASNGAGDGNTASAAGGTVGGSATLECTLTKATPGQQSERKKRKLWTPDEDEELIAAVEKFGEGNWTNILKGSFTHERTAAQLSQRWALIRKRREAVQAAANRLSIASPAAEQGNGSGTPPADQSLVQLHSTQNGTNLVLQNGTLTQNGTIPTPQNGNSTENGTDSTQNGTHSTQNETHAAQNGAHAAQNGTHAATNGIHVATHGIHATQNGTHASQNETLASQNGTPASQSGTNAAQNASSPQNGLNGEHNGSPAQNATNPAQNGTISSQNGNISANSPPVVPPAIPLENGSASDAVPPASRAAMASISPPSATQSQNPVPISTACPSQGTTGASNGSVATTCSAGVGTSTQAAPNAQALAPAGGGGGGGAARITAGSSTPMAVGQIQNPSAKSVSVGVGTGRMIAPGAVVMSAAAAQAGSSGALNSGQPKYAGRSSARGTVSKAVTGPDPGVQAAAMAAGARISPASALLQAGHSGNVVHIRPGGGAVTKAGQGGPGHNASGGSRGTSGAIVHYITTQRPAQQIKSQLGKASGNINNNSSQASSSAATNGSISPTKSSTMSPIAPK